MSIIDSSRATTCSRGESWDTAVAALGRMPATSMATGSTTTPRIPRVVHTWCPTQEDVTTTTTSDSNRRR
eukprot:scaffold5479_cov199-Amphora_coffeaeformis.AAC.21